MNLDRYLSERDLTEAKFADLIGVKQSTVNRLRKGQIPTPSVMAKIVKHTHGAVLPNDFFGVSAGAKAA
jgi:transcriptional regulator with XRE-family HTH domain